MLLNTFIQTDSVLYVTESLNLSDNVRNVAVIGTGHVKKIKLALGVLLIPKQGRPVHSHTAILQV